MYGTLTQNRLRLSVNEFINQGSWPKITGYNLLEANQPPHDKTNKMTVCPGKTQISLGGGPCWSESSLGEQVFTGRTERTNKMTVCPGKTQISLGGGPGWSESSLGEQVILLVLSWGGSFVKYYCTSKLALIAQSVECLPRGTGGHRFDPRPPPRLALRQTG